MLPPSCENDLLRQSFVGSAPASGNIHCHHYSKWRGPTITPYGTVSLAATVGSRLPAYPVSGRGFLLVCPDASPTPFGSSVICFLGSDLCSPAYRLRRRWR